MGVATQKVNQNLPNSGAKNGNANIPSTFSIMPKGKDSALRPTVCRKLTDKYGLCLNLRRRRIE